MPAPQARRKIWIDDRLQGRLISHVSVYLLTASLAIVGLTYVWELIGSAFLALAGQIDRWQLHVASTLLAVLLLAPICMLDIVKVGFRVAGPVYRMRRYIRDLATGMPTTELRFREGDMWPELADEVNELARRIEELCHERDEACAELARQSGSSWNYATPLASHDAAADSTIPPPSSPPNDATPWPGGLPASPAANSVPLGSGAGDMPQPSGAAS